MKRTVALLILAILVLGGCVFRGGSSEKIGDLDWLTVTDTEYTALVNKRMGNENRTFLFYQDLSSLLLGLQSKRIDVAWVPECVAQYLSEQNAETYAVEAQDPVTRYFELHMAVAQSKSDLIGALNDAIWSMKADGTLRTLQEQYLQGDAPAPQQLPKRENARTVRVLLTGDLPPVDYISDDGQPGGFNVAFLSELSARTGFQFEIVRANSASRIAMLQSDKADVVLWMRDVKEYTSGKLLYFDTEKTDELVFTDTYLNLPCAGLRLK